MATRLFYDTNVFFTHYRGYTWIYSPANHEWSRITSHFFPIVEQLLSDNGYIDYDKIKAKFEIASSDTLNEAELESVIQGLLSGKVFFDTQEALLASIEKYRGTCGNHSAVIHMAYLHMTMRCNFNCWYCYNRNEANLTAELPTDQWLSIIHKLRNKGVKSLVFTGGEPLLRDDLENVLADAHSMGLHTELLTNGSLFTRERLERICPLINVIYLSLDAIDELTQGSNRSDEGFDNILSLLEFFSSHESLRNKLVIRTVVTNENIGSVKDFNRVLKQQYGIAHHIFVKYIPTSIEDVGMVPMGELLDEETLKCGDISYVEGPIPDFSNRCEAGAGAIALDPSGDIYPCQSLVGIRRFRMGSVLSDDWYEQFRCSPVYAELCGLSVDDVPVCRDCRFRYLCGGGCPALSWRLYGDIHHRVDYQCDHRMREAPLYLVRSGGLRSRGEPQL